MRDWERYGLEWILHVDRKSILPRLVCFFHSILHSRQPAQRRTNEKRPSGKNYAKPETMDTNHCLGSAVRICIPSSFLHLSRGMERRERKCVTRLILALIWSLLFLLRSLVFSFFVWSQRWDGLMKRRREGWSKVWACRMNTDCFGDLIRLNTLDEENEDRSKVSPTLRLIASYPSIRCIPSRNAVIPSSFHHVVSNRSISASIRTATLRA